MPEDFLHPGFIDDGVIIQDERILSRQSLDTLMTITDIQKDTVITISNPLPQILFGIEIKNPDGLTVYSKTNAKTPYLFKPDMVGKFSVIITNLGDKTTAITVNYGHHTFEGNGNDPKSILDMLSLGLIIMGAYLIIHTDFKILLKTKNPHADNI
ncbi:MAG: hypothetical protein ACREAD_05675 [Nitrosopumilaceae archaeon]